MSEAPAHGLVDWGDPDFQPEVISYGDYDPIRWFRMSHGWPNNPIQDRKFQLGGKERVALLEQQPYHAWTHRFNVQHMGSGVNGTRRCTMEALGRCYACEHYEQAPDKDGKKHGAARCGRRQQTFGVNLLVYKTDLEGQLIDDQNNRILLDEEKGPVHQDGTTADLVYEVFLWRFSADKFQSIREIKTEWGDLSQIDLSFMLAPGKPDNFQDFTPTPLKKCAWRDLGKKDKDKAVALVHYFKENRYDTTAIFGKEYSHEDMSRFLNLSGGQSSQDAAVQAGVGEIGAAIEEELAKIGVDPTVPAATTSSQPEAVPPTPPAPPAESDQPTDFDAILAGS